MTWHWIPSSARSEDAISTARRLRLTAAPPELAKIRDQAVAGLSGFGLTQERAQELYAESERDTYSQELYSILAAAGLG